MYKKDFKIRNYYLTYLGNLKKLKSFYLFQLNATIVSLQLYPCFEVHKSLILL